MQAISTMLEGEIRAAAEAFFGTELPDVELHFGPLPAALNAVAFAQGNHIHLNADCAAPFSRRSLEILGHELTHVIQQRQGRVRADLLVHGLPVNQDAGLEWEAQEMGRRFAHGGCSELPRLPLSCSNPSVIQRLLEVGGKVHWGQRDLSPKSATILDLINGGDDWLAWIVANPTTKYEFADEHELLAGVQMGLHANPLILLKNLGVLLHTYKLAELSEAQLKTILAVENAPENNNSVADISARKALEAQDIWSQSELKIGEEFLVQTGVAQQPLFQAMTLADRIALFDLVNSASTKINLNPMIQKEAAEFSCRYAQAPLEFVDYYQFYMSAVQDQDLKPKLAGKRARLTEAAAEALGPLLYNLLWCPSLPAAPPLHEVPFIVQNWVDRRRFLGFARFSLALWQINQNAGLNGATGPAAQNLISQSMEGVQALLTQQPPTSVTLSQDGMDHYYQYGASGVSPQGLSGISQPGSAKAPKVSAQLRYSAYGNLTLVSFTSTAPK
jgi:hypothetical protein